MTNSLKKLYALKAGDDLAPEECAGINQDLAVISAMDIPPEQVTNVLSYLDRQFLYNQVDVAHKVSLERIARELGALD